MSLMLWNVTIGEMPLMLCDVIAAEMSVLQWAVTTATKCYYAAMRSHCCNAMALLHWHILLLLCHCYNKTKLLCHMSMLLCDVTTATRCHNYWNVTAAIRRHCYYEMSLLLRDVTPAMKCHSCQDVTTDTWCHSCYEMSLLPRCHFCYKRSLLLWDVTPVVMSLLLRDVILACYLHHVLRFIITMCKRLYTVNSQKG